MMLSAIYLYFSHITLCLLCMDVNMNACYVGFVHGLYVYDLLHLFIPNMFLVMFNYQIKFV